MRGETLHLECKVKAGHLIPTTGGFIYSTRIVIRNKILQKKWVMDVTQASIKGITDDDWKCPFYLNMIKREKSIGVN